ncbi:MAG: carbamoyl-phosphate synthase large subunit, partial [Gaiellaceae bacterium]
AAGTAYLSVRDADKAAIRPVAAALAELGFRLLATAGTAAVLNGLEVATIEKGDAVLDAIRTGHCDLVVNTPQGSGARRDGALIRQAALSARVPCITTLSGARLAVDAIANAREEIARSLQERIEHETRAA